MLTGWWRLRFGTCTCRLCEGRMQQRNNGAYQHLSPWERCSSSPHPETRQFSFSLYVPAAFQAVAPSLELRTSFCDQESLCLGPLRRHLDLHQPSIPPGLSPWWFSQPVFVGTALPGTAALALGVWCGAGTPNSSMGPPQLSYLFWFLPATRGYGTSLFPISAPPSSLDMISSLYH